MPKCTMSLGSASLQTCELIGIRALRNYTVLMDFELDLLASVESQKLLAKKLLSRSSLSVLIFG